MREQGTFDTRALSAECRAMREAPDQTTHDRLADVGRAATQRAREGFAQGTAFGPTARTARAAVARQIMSYPCAEA